MKQVGIFLLIVLGWASIGAASEMSLSAQVSHQSVGVNQQFVYEVTLTGETFRAADHLELPSFSPGFEILAKGSSQSMSMINGQINRSETLVITLRPVKEGNFRLSSAKISIKGQTLTSEEVTVKVGPSGQQASAQKNQRIAGDQSALPIFAKATVSKSSVFVGEEVRYNLALYRSVQLWSNIAFEFPKIVGMWVENIQVPKDSRQETINGRPHAIHPLVIQKLYPLAPGKIRIPSTKVAVVINPFEGQRQVQTQELVLTVKPLPEAGKPAFFSGGVGNFVLKITHPKTKKVKRNEPITLIATLSGSGNFQSISDLYLEPTEAFKSYQSKKSSTQGRKQFEYVLIPKQVGTFKLPQVKYAYFNPKNGKYSVLTSEEFTITVEESESGDAMTVFKTGQTQPLYSEEMEYLARARKGKVSTALWKDPWVMIWAGINTIITALFIRAMLKKKGIRLRRKNKSAIVSEILKDLNKCDEYKAVETLSILEHQMARLVTLKGISKEMLEAIQRWKDGLNQLKYSKEGGESPAIKQCKEAAIALVKRMKKEKEN